MTPMDAVRHVLERTPLRTFVIYPLGVIAFELMIRHGKLAFVPWGLPLLAWATCSIASLGTIEHGSAAAGPASPSRRTSS